MPPAGQPHRDFKGVWIPKEIWLAQDLSLQEKALFVEIHSLDNEHGCYATNGHFARFIGCAERTVQNYLKTLQQGGYIKIESTKTRTAVGQYFDARIIRTAGQYARHPSRGLMKVEFFENESGERIARIYEGKDRA